ncbi:hypothetical protein Cgig2_003910 [Carnegiea gigantea]|uniref:RNA-binding protein 48 n=1 Tax=Carnegiea gigantea TaxID=171969 RepID=A0A9Q1QD60_9CARY|nr:hypothetical protein Cgig2_031409 [Carnegiea gigantea]KAJ8439844.1 hypothetical protein Cgig2_003910 [Carnegiea gigantea]
MPRYKDEPLAVRVYTVCDESKYLIVRNVPALGCGDGLKQLCATYGEIEDCKPMDAEECEQFTGVYWIEFRQIKNPRFAKRKLDESVFLGDRLQVSYAPEYESLSDTKEKLQGRRKEVLVRLKPGRSRGYEMNYDGVRHHPLSDTSSQPSSFQLDYKQGWYDQEKDKVSQASGSSITRVSSDQDYFPSRSMNETVRMVREKLNNVSIW